MSKARGFTNQRITNILMFLTWGNLEARILPNHAAFISLARNMQLLFFNSRFGPACFGQGKRRAARHLLRFSPLHISASILGLRTQSRLLLILRHVPCNPINLYRMFLAGQQACPQGLLSCFLGHLGRSNHPVSQGIYSYLSLRPSYLVGSKWAVLHKMAFSDPAGFHSLAVIRKQILCNLFSPSISLGSMDYLLVAVLNRSQPYPRPPACDGPGLRPPPSQLIENHCCDLKYRVYLTVSKRWKLLECLGSFIIEPDLREFLSYLLPLSRACELSALSPVTG